MNHKLLILSIVLLLINLSCSEEAKVTTEKIQDQTESETDTVQEEITEEKPLLRIGTGDELLLYVRADYEPYMFLNKDNELSGFYVDIEKAIMEEMNQKYKMIPWTDIGKVIQDVKVGVVHGVLGCPQTADMEKMFQLSDVISTLEAVTFVHNDNTDIGGNTKEEVIKSLYGKKVGIQARDAIFELLSPYKDITVIEYKTGTEALEKLANKEVDAKPEVREIAMYNAKMNNWPIKPVGVPIMSSILTTTGFYQGINPEFMKRYNSALKRIKDSGLYDQIYNNWFLE